MLATGACAWAGDPFPVAETFRGPAFGAQWRSGGSAELTGAHEADGWLRLTSAAGGEFGYAYDDEAFPATDGALVEFEYADWGGSGADGLTFFLFDGATGEGEFHAGQPGGALGYASCNNSSDGLSNAYVGVGFDEYGNFTNLGSICGLDGTEFLANHVSVRGSSSESYKLLATAPTTESLRAERPQARRVTIAITPTGRLSVYVGYPDGTYQQVTEGFQLPAAPETLKFGYVASTGALTDYHEIRDAQVMKPTQLTPSVAQTAGGHERGEPLTWTAVVRNEGPNPTEREQVRATTRGQALSNASWTCEAAGGAECATAGGAGMPSPEAGAMPPGSSLTYKITGTPTATTDYAQMTVESEPRGDTGEVDPEKERASATTNLTPLFEQEPSFTLATDGEANATTAAALGGEISYGYAWQRCEADGTSCADIPGAQAPTYHTTGADVGHTIRFTQTARNSAGTATVDSAVYQLPTAKITSAPGPHVATREAALSFTASANEATLECSLDEAPWSVCASPQSYQGLADGEHTFSVRAVYGGLSGPKPSTARWTVEATPPPAPTIVSPPGPVSAPTLEGTLPSELPHATPHERTATSPHHTARHKPKAAKRRSAKHKRKTKTRRHAVKRKRETARRRGAAKHKQKSSRRRHAAVQKAKTRQRPTSKPRPKARTPRPGATVKAPSATTHTHEQQTPPPAAAPPPKDKAPPPGTAPKSKLKAFPPRRTRNTATKTRPPAVTRRPGDTSPAPASAPGPAQGPPRRISEHTRHVKARRPAPKPRSTRAPGAGRKPKHKPHAPPVVGPTRKGQTRAAAPTQTKTRTHAKRRARKHKRTTRRKAGGVGTKLVIRPFRPHSSALASRARRLVERVAAAVPHARLIVCVGYTDDLGARSANVALGLARARAVCARLRSLGVRAAFKAESRGPQRPCASNATAGGRALNRRVEVTIVR